jgi:hypothetical protein
MAGGGNYVLNKGLPVLTTYNSSAAAGVTQYRCVKYSGSPATAIDLNTAATTLTIGIVQENIDATKVLYGKAVASVAMLGITKAYVAASGTVPVVGDKVTAGAAGGVVKAATGGTNFAIGIVVGPLAQTIAAGDLIDVLLTPTGLLVA